MQREVALLLIRNLPTAPNKLAVLNEAKTMISALDNADLFELSNVLPFENVFDVFTNSSNGEEVKLACDITNKLLFTVDPVNVLNRFHDMLLRGLQSSSEPILNLCLDQILRLNLNNAQHLQSLAPLLPFLIVLIENPSLEVAKRAAYAVVLLGQRTEGIEMLLQPTVISQLQQTAEKNDVVQCRVFEMLVDMAGANSSALEAWHNTDLMRQLVATVTSDDILVKLNSVELLSRLSQTPHGLFYLQQQGIMRALEQQLRNIDNDPLGSLLLPGLIKFFGNVAHYHPDEIHENLQVFMQKLVELLHDSNVSLRIIAVETVAHISDSLHGKYSLFRNEVLMRKACEALGPLIKAGSEDDRQRALKSLAVILHLKSSDQTPELLEATEKWSEGVLPGRLLHVLMDVARQPFAGLHCAALNVIKSLALVPWGQNKLHAHPGFEEYLLNRTTETFKEGKECKYDIVAALVQSPSTASIFGNVYFTKLHQYYVEGPFYIAATAAVAIEGE